MVRSIESGLVDSRLSMSVFIADRPGFDICDTHAPYALHTPKVNCGASSADAGNGLCQQIKLY